MDTVAPAIFLLVRLLLMSPEGTELLSEHRARVPRGGTGLVRETLSLPGMPGAVHVYLKPGPPAPAGSAGTSPPEGDAPAGLPVALRVELWEHASEALTGTRPLETNEEAVVLTSGGSALVQVAEDPLSDLRLVLSLSSPPEPVVINVPGPEPPAAPGRIAFRVEASRSTPGLREILETHQLMTLERSPISWESRWRNPVPRESGERPVYREERFSLRMLPIVTDSGWISVEAVLSVTLYPPDEDEPLNLSSRVTRTVPMGIPFEISLDLPPDISEADGSGDGGAEEPVSIVLEITPYRPGIED
jgi:hypothetical protein